MRMETRTHSLGFWCSSIVFLVFFSSPSIRAQAPPLSDLDALRCIASYLGLSVAFGVDRAKGWSTPHFRAPMKIKIA